MLFFIETTQEQLPEQKTSAVLAVEPTCSLWARPDR